MNKAPLVVQNFFICIDEYLHKGKAIEDLLVAANLVSIKDLQKYAGSMGKMAKIAIGDLNIYRSRKFPNRRDGFSKTFCRTVLSTALDDFKKFCGGA